jgi:ATP-dependent RNA helicase MSS116
MAPPPKRKFNRSRGGGAANGSGSGTPDTPTTPRSTMAQQPKRPKVAETLPAVHSSVEGTVDVKQMYSTSAGEATAKPFSTLSSVLDKTLLEGLDKMGFE